VVLVLTAPDVVDWGVGFDVVIVLLVLGVAPLLPACNAAGKPKTSI